MPETEPTPDAGGARAPAGVVDVAVGEIHDRGLCDHPDTSDPAYRVLASSVRRRGIVEPLVVRRRPEGGYQLVSGARRLQAAREAGHAAVPVTIRELGEAAAVIGGAWASLSRSGVSDEEAARVRVRLVDAGVSEADAGALTDSLPRGGVELTGRAAPPVRAATAPAWAWADPERPKPAPAEAEETRPGLFRRRRS